MAKSRDEKERRRGEVISPLMSFAYVVDRCRPGRGGKSFIDTIDNRMVM